MLALGLAKLFVENGWIKRDYVLEQTDMPLLVRKDTGKFLRESDVTKDGRSDVFYVWDQRAKKPIAAPGSMGLRGKDGDKDGTLRLVGIDAALEGVFSATLATGDNIDV